MRKETEYKLEQLTVEALSLPEHFINTEAFVELNNPMFREVRCAFRTHIAQREVGEEIIEFQPPRQSFWDYVLRRKPKTFRVKVKASDILKFPPKPHSHDVIRVYDFEPELIINNSVYPNQNPTKPN